MDEFDTTYDNLLLFGDTGVGKTFLTNCIEKELLDSSNSVIYLTAVELFQCFEQQDFNKPDTSDTAIDSSYILDCDLLIIDDLGTEFANSYNSVPACFTVSMNGFSEEKAWLSQPTSLSDIRNMYSSEFFSRLTSAYKLLKLAGDDIRLLKKTGQKP